MSHDDRVSLPGPPQPVDRVLPALLAAVHDHRSAVLVAPPGTGKTTRVPLALPRAPDRRVVVLEPRRVAARAAASRLAAQLDAPIGRHVGLTTRDERLVGRATDIEVVTEGVVLRRLLADPALPEVGTLVFDERHERTLEGDLALAFALETRAVLRPDLALLVLSATLDAERVAGLLGGAPILTAEARTYPVEVEHVDLGVPLDGNDLRATVVPTAAVVRDEVAASDGDVLVFLPGTGEIRQVRAALSELPPPGDVEVVVLHGGLPADEQDRALRPAPGGRRRVVLSTDLAETSVTLPGVRVVVDAGWSREPRFDASNQMTGLVTVPASRASAEQRAGRAGRVAPGRCVRLWPASAHHRRDAHARPAIATDDLTSAALDVAVWGTPITELALLDPPPAEVWEAAIDTLRGLGAVDDEGVTAHGRSLARLPVHPRLGQLLLTGAARGDLTLAAEVAAVLGDRDPLVVDRLRPVSDLAERITWLRGRDAPSGAHGRRGARQRLRRDTARLRRLVVDTVTTPGDTADGDLGDRIGALVLSAWPDRLGARRGERRGTYVLAGGRGAELPDGDPLADEPLLAVAALDRGRTAARIHLAAPVDAATVAEVLGDRVEVDERVAWVDGDVRAERLHTVGAVVLRRQPLEDPVPDAVVAALLEGLAAEGLDLLDRRPEDLQLQARLQLLASTLGAPWSPVDDATLLAASDETLAPFLHGFRRRRDLRRVRVRDVLRARIPGGRLDEVDRLAPTHLTVPSGSRVRLEYRTEGPPVLAARVQELFGARRTPTVLDGRVPVVLHLLSPAGRPVQVTEDLAGFWTGAYPQVRAELRGRYPKHAWPEDGATATPLRGTGRRRR
jgi:ATP-dependent helicase HrpB